MSEFLIEPLRTNRDAAAMNLIGDAQLLANIQFSFMSQHVGRCFEDSGFQICVRWAMSASAVRKRSTNSAF